MNCQYIKYFLTCMSSSQHLLCHQQISILMISDQLHFLNWVPMAEVHLHKQLEHWMMPFRVLLNFMLLRLMTILSWYSHRYSFYLYVDILWNIFETVMINPAFQIFSFCSITWHFKFWRLFARAPTTFQIYFICLFTTF